MKDNRIEELFKEWLLESEADVPDGTWKAIENSLDSMMPATRAVSQSGSLGALGKAIVGGVIVSGIALSVYLFSADNAEILPEPVAPTESVEEFYIETVTEINKPFSSTIKTETVLDKTEEPERTSYETFSAREEINPLADQSVEINTELPVAEPLTEMNEPVSESRITEVIETDPSTTVDDNSTELVANEASPLPTVNFNDVITPNLDNVNDIFRVEANEAVASFTVTVMNLNGKVIHQWNAPNGFWDGKMENGQMAPSGKYLVDIFVQPLNGSPYHKPVTIQLIR